MANFAHEMKTPMTSIVGYAQMLSCYELSEEERRTAAETIRREASRLETLSLQMLEWSVYRRGEAELKSIALSDVAQSLQQTLKAVSRKYCIPFCVRLDDVRAEADPVLLMSLLYNLADNAFKASQGSEVTVYSTVRGDRVTLCVKDRGRGIARENIEKLTEAFYREDRSRSRALGGAGLGLFICQQIASLHGTALRFDSVLGAGTEVSFELKRVGEADV